MITAQNNGSSFLQLQGFCHRYGDNPVLNVSVLPGPHGMETVSTFVLQEFDQGSPGDAIALGVIALSISMLSVSLTRRLVPRQC